MRNVLRAIAPLICASVAGVDALSAEEWQKQTIYQVVTDRFARTPSDDSGLGIIKDPDSDADCPLPKQYCGGTWQGITDKLDYIQGMGFTAIWISPVIENTENASSDYSYHGYWPRNFYALNPHFGTEEDLVGLSDALHARGMYLMFDIVINHVFSPGPGNATDYSMFTPFNSSKYFHRPCVMDNSNETSVEVCQLRDDKATAVFTLPDVKTEDPEVRSIFQEWIKDTVQKYNVDGLRLDTYKHIERDFWPEFIDAAGVFSVAEFLNGDPANYDSELVPSKDEGVLNYPTFYWIRRIFQNPQTWMTELVQGVKTMRNGPLDTNLLAPFFENHDEQRFASLVGDIALTKNALAFTLLFDGIPIIYQGQEQHFSGQNDPFNRERLWTSGYNEDSELYRWITQLNKIRALALDSDPSFISSQADTIWPPQAPPAGNTTGGGNSTTNSTTTSTTTTVLTNHHIALKKGSLITVLTNVGVGGDKLDVVLPRNATKYKPGGAYIDLLSCEAFKADRSGALSFEMGWLPRVFYPALDALSSGLCLLPQGPAGDDGEKCLVTFNITTTTSFGQNVQILGDIPQLGSKDRHQAVTLGSYFYTSDNPLWSLTFELPAGEQFSYQYLKMDGSGTPLWDGGNRSVALHSYTVPEDCVDGKTVSNVDKWTGAASNATSSPAARSVLSRGSMNRLRMNLWNKGKLRGILSHFFQFPGEIRDVIYRQALIANEGTLVRSFTPPPLLCTGRRLRDKALPLFYKYNHFEITVKRSLADTKLAMHSVSLPSVDARVWRRFLDMWNVFNTYGTNGLKYVQRATVIYQLSTVSGFTFGDSPWDQRLGFRFSRAPLDEGGIKRPDERDTKESMEGKGRSVVLNRGKFSWPCRSETERFLFEKIREIQTGKLWEIYPLKRMANMLWRCARDCPQAAENVDFLCEDFQKWIRNDNDMYEEYDVSLVEEAESFYDPDDEDDERQERAV